MLLTRFTSHFVAGNACNFLNDHSLHKWNHNTNNSSTEAHLCFKKIRRRASPHPWKHRWSEGAIFRRRKINQRLILAHRACCQRVQRKIAGKSLENPRSWLAEQPSVYRQRAVRGTFFRKRTVMTSSISPLRDNLPSFLSEKHTTSRESAVENIGDTLVVESNWVIGTAIKSNQDTVAENCWRRQWWRHRWQLWQRR